MPLICFRNGLEFSQIPECLQLTDLESQLIALDLVFIKIRQLPKTQMDIMNDRVINVPIGDEDVALTVQSLPRTSENDGIELVGVKLKRKLGMKNHHKLQMVRANQLLQALKYLKAHHPEYQNIEIKDNMEWIEPQESLQVGESQENAEDDQNMEMTRR